MFITVQVWCGIVLCLLNRFVHQRNWYSSSECCDQFWLPKELRDLPAQSKAQSHLFILFKLFVDSKVLSVQIVVFNVVVHPNHWFVHHQNKCWLNVGQYIKCMCGHCSPSELRKQVSSLWVVYSNDEFWCIFFCHAWKREQVYISQAIIFVICFDRGSNIAGTQVHTVGLSESNLVVPLSF